MDKADQVSLCDRSTWPASLAHTRQLEAVIRIPQQHDHGRTVVVTMANDNTFRNNPRASVPPSSTSSSPSTSLSSSSSPLPPLASFPRHLHHHHHLVVLLQSLSYINTIITYPRHHRVLRERVFVRVLVICRRRRCHRCCCFCGSGTDRSNIVEMLDPARNYPLSFGESRMFKSATVVWSSQDIDNLTPEDTTASMASSGYYKCAENRQCKGNPAKPLNSELDNAPASYPGMLLQFTQKECYHYMCTRNNNFTNRSQKGTLCIKWVRITRIPYVYEGWQGLMHIAQSWIEIFQLQLAMQNVYQ